MKYFNQICLGLCLFVLTACVGPQTIGPQGNYHELREETARQRDLFFDKQMQEQNKLYNLSFPLMAANSSFCNDTVAPLYGLVPWNIRSIPTKYQPSAKKLFQLGPRTTLRTIAAGSPADKAGLKSGDILISINGIKLPEGRQGIQTLKQQVGLSQYKSVNIYYERAGEIASTVIQPVRGCNYPVRLIDSAAINAFADGSSIYVSRGMLRFVENNDELVLVIAHELAHNAMNHVKKLQQNAMAGTLGGMAIDALLGAAGVSSGNQFSRLGAEIGATRYSVSFEQEADYVGMYFMQRAGYNTQGVADFWRRLAAEGSASLDQRRTHPTSPERFLAIEHTHNEIQTKKTKKQPLLPNSR